MVDASLTFIAKRLDTFLRHEPEGNDGGATNAGIGGEGDKGNSTTEQLLDDKLHELTTSVEMFKGAQIFTPTLEQRTG